MLPLGEDMFVPSEMSVQMTSKVFNIFCLWERVAVDINGVSGFSAVGEGGLDPFAFIRHRES
jgi:hypothetical protein